jgi:hypothetical protein
LGPIAEYKADVTALVEAKIIREDAIDRTLYLLLTDEERKEYREDLGTVKRDDRFLALTRIHDHHTYREDYRSWDEFLHHELCVENPHDWWETEKRRFRIQQLLDERGIKFRVPLNKKMADHLNRVRHDADLFAACCAEFQALPEDRQTAKRLGEIVQRHLDRKNKLGALRRSVPDATEEELSILAPLSGADQRWRNWYPQHTRELHERAQASGRPVRECMLEMAREIKALPSDAVLLGVDRGRDLVPLVNDLARMAGQWERERRKKEEIEAWERLGRRLGIWPPSSEEAKEEATPGGDDTGGKQGDEDQDDEDEGQDREEATGLYDLDLTGEFAEPADRRRLSPEELADLLREMADSLDTGWVITRPSSLTVRPAVRPEQPT